MNKLYVVHDGDFIGVFDNKPDADLFGLTVTEALINPHQKVLVKLREGFSKFLVEFHDPVTCLKVTPFEPINAQWSKTSVKFFWAVVWAKTPDEAIELAKGLKND